jgi:hypothetical protein
MLINKNLLKIWISSFVLLTVSTATGYAAQTKPQSYQLAAMNPDDILDLPKNHWAYNAVKVLVADLKIMPLKSANQFKGDDLLTRYDLADIFYRAIKKLEAVSGKDLHKAGGPPPTELVDVKPAYKEAVDAIVNEYKIMLPMPGKKFWGDDPLNRYGIAFELYNYFLLLESLGNGSAPVRRDRISQLKDLKADHWATKAITEIVDKYQIMDGYPDQSFRGGKRLTRYEGAAIIREFMRYVNNYLIPIDSSPTASP